MIRRRVLVHGMVQGVFFRDTVRRHAVTRSVAGWARNRADGTVEAVFEGDADDVSALVALCRDGPRGARVDRIDIFEESPVGLTDFSIG